VFVNRGEASRCTNTDHIGLRDGTHLGALTLRLTRSRARIP
jgi:hypothetical protein